MGNPALTDKRFEAVREEWEPGYAAPAATPDAATATRGDALPPKTARGQAMTANGTFA